MSDYQIIPAPQVPGYVVELTMNDQVYVMPVVGWREIGTGHTLVPIVLNGKTADSIQAITNSHSAYCKPYEATWIIRERVACSSVSGTVTYL